MRWIWPWRRAKELNRRVDLAREEVRRSEELLARDRANIIEPLARADAANHFSGIVRRGLAIGYGNNHKRGNPA